MFIVQARVCSGLYLDTAQVMTSSNLHTMLIDNDVCSPKQLVNGLNTTFPETAWEQGCSLSGSSKGGLTNTYCLRLLWYNDFKFSCL